MKTVLYGWVKNIVYYLILVGIVLNILPNIKYEKYVKMVSGIIIIVIMINPMLEMVGLTEKIDISLTKKIYEQQIDNINYSMFDAIEQQKQSLFNEYGKEIEKNIQDIVEKQGLNAASVKVNFYTEEDDENYGEIQNISIYICEEKNIGSIYIDEIRVNNENTMNYEKYEIVKVKKLIMEFYNLSYENINITIQG